MSALIKSASVPGRPEVRQLATPLVRPSVRQDDPLGAEARRIADLENEISRLNLAMEDLGLQHEEAIETAMAEARADALARFERDDAERLAAIAEALDLAGSGLAQLFSETEQIALEISRTVLQAMFAPSDDYAERASRMISRQVGDMAIRTRFSLRVSASDFADDNTLATLEARHPLADIVRDPSLGPGEARIDLALGSVELSCASQMERVLQEILAMAAREPGP